MKKVVLIGIGLFTYLHIMFLGFALTLAIYNRHLCCDKGSDWYYFLLLSLFCITVVFVLLACIKIKK